MRSEMAIFQAVLVEDQEHAVELMSRLSAEQLHELQWVSLTMCALAREMILSGGIGSP